MRYMGSKARHAKRIVPVLMDGHADDSWYVEPFMGGGNLFAHVPCKNRYGTDVAEYAVALLIAVRDGWIPPEIVTESEYKRVKQNPGDYPDYYVGFLAYSCSYAGKFWGGYCRGKNNKGDPRNYAQEQVRHLAAQREGLLGTHMGVCSYHDVDPPAGSTVYFDPPYAGTTSYNSGDFNHNSFWEHAASLSENCRVFVSEYTAPPNWSPVWQKSVTSSLDKDTGALRAVEKLFTITK